MTFEPLFENRSVSDITLEEGNRVKKILLEAISENQNSEIQRIDTMLYVTVKHGTVNFEQPIFGKVKNINYEIFFFKSEDDLKDVFNKIDFGGSYNYGTNEIVITSYALNEKVDNRFLNATLFHEMHHVFQLTAYELSDKAHNIYSIAQHIINNTDMYGDNTLLYKLAYCIYFLDKTEIDANMQSLYQELTQGDTDKKLRNRPLTNIGFTFDKIKCIYEILLEQKENENFCNLVKDTFKVNFNSILNFLIKRIEYFEDKRQRVLGRYLSEEKKKKNIKRKFKELIIF